MSTVPSTVGRAAVFGSPGRPGSHGRRLIVGEFDVAGEEVFFSSADRPALRAVPAAPPLARSGARRADPKGSVRCEGVRGACERGGRSRTRAVPAAIRWACAALVAVALAVAGLVVGTLMGPSPSADPAAHPRVVVQSGDTLWSIAEGVEGAPDTATAVADIAALNGLPSHAVAPGPVLELPRY